MPRIVVLGSNSFGGASFVDFALTAGCDVLGFSRSEEVHPVLRPYAHNPFRDRFRFTQADINIDFEEIAKTILAYRPDYVVDFAGQGMVAPSWDWPEQWYQTNIVSKVKLHKRLAELDGLKRYVRISTPEVFGDCDGLIDENRPFNPSTPYAVSHAAIDMSLATFHRQWNFPVVITRFANFYGPGQQLFRIVPKTIICVLTGNTLMLHGGGRSTRAFLHGRDVASAVFAAMTRGANGEAYHFSTEEFVTIRKLVETCAGLLEADLSSFVRDTEDRPGKDMAYLMSSKKAAQQLGWQPEVSLKQGLVDCIAWVRDNLKTIKTLPQDYIHKP